MSIETDKVLTDKQRRFVNEFLIDLSGTHAAIRAGYARKSAAKIAWELLQHPHVAKAVAEEKAARERRTRITADRVLEQFGRAAFFDTRKLFTPSGALKPIHEIGDDEAIGIAGLETVEMTDAEGNVTGVVRKVRFIDRTAAMDKLARHLGLYERDNARTVKGEIAMLVDAVQDADPFRPALDDGDNDLAA